MTAPPPATIPPHKPLFLCAGLWAVVSPLVWLWPGLSADPVFWHQHELFFGMAAAAIGGYLLTALPHWATGGIRPAALRLLILCWAAGRIAQIWPDPAPVALLAVALSYPLFLCLLVFVPLLRARAWPRLWMGALPLALAGAEAASLTAHLQGTAAGLPLALTLGFSLMIGLIGGRIVPAFTRSRLRLVAAEPTLRDRAAAGLLAALATLAGMILLARGAVPSLAGITLLMAGALQALRLSGWWSLHLKSEPDILMMQVAFAWLAAGLGLAGAALLWPDALRFEDALHALTMGAMGGMILAIAARPLLPRAAGRLRVTPDIALSFALLCTATAARVLLADAQVAGLAGRQWAAWLWCAAWATFVLRSLHHWNRPAPYPILSAHQGGVGQGHARRPLPE